MAGDFTCTIYLLDIHLVSGLYVSQGVIDVPYMTYNEVIYTAHFPMDRYSYGMGRKTAVQSCSAVL